MDIIIDTKGEAELLTKDKLNDSDDDDCNDNGTGLNLLEGLITVDDPVQKPKRISRNDVDLEEFEREMGWTNHKKRQPPNAISVTNITKELTALDKIMEKSVIKPGFEKLESVPRYEMSRKTMQKLRREERSKTKGKKWFGMSAPEMTDEVRHDLEVIQMRSVLDPKHFYKKNDLAVLPKFFQIGKVVDSPIDYYNNRLTKKERKKTIVDELLADAEFSKYNKRKYKEIIDDNRKKQYKSHRHAAKLKRKNKSK